MYTLTLSRGGILCKMDGECCKVTLNRRLKGKNSFLLKLTKIGLHQTSPQLFSDFSDVGKMVIIEHYYENRTISKGQLATRRIMDCSLPPVLRSLPQACTISDAHKILLTTNYFGSLLISSINSSKVHAKFLFYKNICVTW